jgi:hypothetical protein
MLDCEQNSSAWARIRRTEARNQQVPSPNPRAGIWRLKLEVTIGVDLGLAHGARIISR